MEKLDIGILIGAGVMAMAAAGLYFSGGEVAILTPMEPSSDVPVFQKFDADKHAAERRRIAVVTPNDRDDPVTLAFHRAAKGLRNSPCSAPARQAFLASMTAYARHTMRESLARARSGEEDPVLTPLQAQAGEYFNTMPMYGYITTAEYREVLKAASPGMALFAGQRDPEMAGVMDAMAGDACERRKRGEDQPVMSWEPQPGEAEEREMRDRIRRRG